MDDFGAERAELSGTLISMEFDSGGRIHQLWAADPNLPEEGQEFQFVITPVSFGEEFAEDYYPGTILLGARTGQHEPWILDRNKSAVPIQDQSDGRTVAFEYDLHLLSDLRVTGRYHEIAGALPQVAWDVRIANRGKENIEVGEVAFPMAFNNLFEGEPDAHGKGGSLVDDRVRLHPFVAGAASHLYVNRMNGAAPGLLIFPGDETGWELCASVPASLMTPHRWCGIQVIYVLSRAAVEREGWDARTGTGSSLILEPGDSKVFQTRFAPTPVDFGDAVSQALLACGRPAFRILPSAVAPKEVGIALEMAGAVPQRFLASGEAELETDSDEEGGFCFLRPKNPGPTGVAFEDTLGRRGEVQLYFTDPIESLIKRRADWIAANQVHDEPGSSLNGAILAFDYTRNKRLDEPEAYASPYAIESGLCDALFLAEKNSLYPDPEQIKILDRALAEFVRDDLQNPADGSVGATFNDLHSVAVHYGRPQTYSLVLNLHHAMARLAMRTACTQREPREYLEDANRTALAMFRQAISATAAPCIPAISQSDALVADMRQEGMHDQADALDALFSKRAESVLKAASKIPHDWIWDCSGFEEVAWAARRLEDPDWFDKIVRYAFSARGGAPSWWRFGSDPRAPYMNDGAIPIGFWDRAEVYQGHTSPANSMLFLQMADRDYDTLPESLMRIAFGGLVGSWALVMEDGRAAQGYCPDPASKQHGPSPFTGDLGLALFNYLRGVCGWVLPSKTFGILTFGCHFESDSDSYLVRPWDGVGRRIVMRQIGFEAAASFGKMSEVRLDSRKRWASVQIECPWNKPSPSVLHVKGLWGKKFEIDGKAVQPVDGELRITTTLPKSGTASLMIKAVE